MISRGHIPEFHIRRIEAYREAAKSQEEMPSGDMICTILVDDSDKSKEIRGIINFPDFIVGRIRERFHEGRIISVITADSVDRFIQVLIAPEQGSTGNVRIFVKHTAENLYCVHQALSDNDYNILRSQIRPGPIRSNYRHVEGNPEFCTITLFINKEKNPDTTWSNTNYVNDVRRILLDLGLGTEERDWSVEPAHLFSLGKMLD